MDARRFARTQGGFNIVEIMVVLAILATLAAIAAPNMAAVIRTQRLKTAAFDVYSSIVFARSEAIKRNTTVTITPVASTWSRGWEIRDGNNNVLRQQSGWETIESTGPAQIRFGASGRLLAVVNDIALTAANVQAAAHRCIKIDASGRPVTKEGSC